MLGKVNEEDHRRVMILFLVSMFVAMKQHLQPWIGLQKSVRPKSSFAGTIRIVLVCPFPPRQP